MNDKFSTMIADRTMEDIFHNLEMLEEFYKIRERNKKGKADFEKWILQDANTQISIIEETLDDLVREYKTYTK